MAITLTCMTIIAPQKVAPKSCINKLSFSTPSALVCNYKLTYQPDSTVATKRQDFFKLIISQGNSRFQSQSSRSRDSLTAIMVSFLKTPQLMSIYMNQLFRLPITNQRYIIYKFQNTGKIVYYDWIGSKIYHYEEMPSMFKWVNTADKANISGYECQRALTFLGGRKFEAWYTREIPVSDGPYKFCGLPGLIVKVNDLKNHYVFELKNISYTKSTVDITLPKNSAVTNKAKLKSGLAVYQAGLLDRTASMGNSVTVSDRQAAVERAKRQNNPLELK